MKVLVSSCIMGKNCKYNGGNNLNPKVVEFLKDKEVIEICPELLANMPTPVSYTHLHSATAGFSAAGIPPDRIS